MLAKTNNNKIAASLDFMRLIRLSNISSHTYEFDTIKNHGKASIYLSYSDCLILCFRDHKKRV